VGLLDRISAARGTVATIESRNGIDQWLSNYLIPAFSYNGMFYSAGTSGLVQTLAGNKASEISATLPSYTAAVRQTPPAFAAQMVRALVLSQARFRFRNRSTSKTPKRMFGTSALSILEQPWPNGTTGELVSRMEWHAGLAGNAYVAYQAARRGRPERLRVLRPDWCALVYGSDQEPEDAAFALDGELIGLVYQNGGLHQSGNKPQTMLVGSFAHWAPMPDPLNAGIGMSWLTPAIRELQADQLAAQHKINYFSNGATPNLVVKGLAGQNGQPLTATQFNELVDMMESKHAGVANAYRTLYLTAGADATVIGNSLSQIDFKATIGAGETRIAVLSRVPAALLGISEGLAGSSLNAGNFSAARRMFADTWVYPNLQDLAASLAAIVKVPSDAELWFDVADMPILREDAKDAADITLVQMQAIEAGVRAGYDPANLPEAVVNNDLTRMTHTGLTSVQLQPPGTAAPDSAATPTPGAAAPAALAASEDFRV